MRVTAFAVLATAAMFAPATQAASPPAAPQVTVGADIKQLIFDWEDVAGTTYYRLLVKAGTAPFKPLIDNIPASTTSAKLSVSVHLLRWMNTRYAVAACNSSGCTNSALIPPQNLMLDSIGYFKASNTDRGDLFGTSLLLSDDGKTLAVTAPQESGSGTGVNSNWANNDSKFSGAVYVFRRKYGGWRQEAYLKAGENYPYQHFGTTLSPFERAVAFNADGTMIAIGMPGPGSPDSPLKHGVVYIYQRADSRWSLTATLTSPAPQDNDEFGTSLDMSLDGRTLKVNSFEAGGRTYIFIRPRTTWQHSVTLDPFYAGDECPVVNLSRDGSTLVSSCVNPDLGLARLETRKRSGNTWTHVADQPLDDAGGSEAAGVALDYDASTLALQEPRLRRVSILRWSGSDWAHETTFPQPDDVPYFFSYGSSVALNRTGNVLAIGNYAAAEDGAGVSPVLMPGTQNRGAVYVWRRDDRNPLTWKFRSVVKSSNPINPQMLFGGSIDLCGTGNALAIGNAIEYGGTRGVDGDQTDTSKPGAGAVYLY